MTPSPDGSAAFEATLLDSIPVEVPPQRRLVIFLLLSLTVLLHVLTAGWGPLENGQEGWTAAVARQLAMGQTPAHLSENWASKVRPTFATWITAQSFRAFGVSEISARLPAALAVLAICWMVYLIAERQGGITRGLVAAVMAVTTSGPLLFGKLAGGSAIFVCWMVMALYCMARLLEQKPMWKRWLPLFWLALTLAVLTAGSQALIVPAGASAVLLVSFRQARLRLKVFRSWQGLLLALLAVACVYFYRRTGSVFSYDLPQKLTWTALPAVFFPWALIILPAAFLGLRRVLRLREMECNEALLWAWLMLGLAWMIGGHWTGVWPEKVALLWPLLALVCAIIWERFNSGFRIIACSLLIVAGAVGLFFCAQLTGGEWTYLLQPIWWLSCGVIIVFGAAALVFARQRHSRAAVLALAAAVVPLAFNLMDAHARHAAAHTFRDLARDIDLKGSDRKMVWLDAPLRDCGSFLFYAPVDLKAHGFNPSAPWPPRFPQYVVCLKSRAPLWAAHLPNTRASSENATHVLLKISP